MGASPHTPYEIIKMGEHVPSDKLIVSGACRVDRFCHPINRK